MAYDKGTNYSLLMDEAAKKGDYAAAAQYEQMRNEKIDGTGSSHAKTNLYSQYLQTDAAGTKPAGNVGATGGSLGAAAGALGRALGKGSDGTGFAAYKDENGKTTTYRPEFAGQTVQIGTQLVTYNERGYPVKSLNADHAKKLGNAYTMQNMGLDQTKISNAADLYRGLYNAVMNNPTTVGNSGLNNAYGKRNIQYSGDLTIEDYDRMIREAAGKGQNVLAGYYEDSRNALIADRGLNPNLQTSNYNGGWNWVDNGGGVGSIYAGALRDDVQTDQALGGGWYLGQGKGDAEQEYFYSNTDAPTMQEVMAYARAKGYDTEDESAALPLGALAREMMAGGYVSPENLRRAELLGAAMPAVLNNLGIENGYTGAAALENAVRNMQNAGGGSYAKALAAPAAAAAGNSLSNPYSAAIAGGGGYSMGGNRNNGGVSYGGSAYGGSLENQLMGIYGNGGAYSAALQQMKNLTNAQTAAARSGYEGEQENVNRSYADMARQLYINRENAQKNIGQQMAAQGITGGAAESTLLGLNTSYQEALRQNEQERIAMIDELERAIVKAQLEGDIAYAQQALQMEQNRIDNQANMMQYMLSRQDDAAAQAYSQQMDKAQMLASAGDFSGYKALGYSDEEVATLNKAYQVANAPKYRSPAPAADPSEEDYAAMKAYTQDLINGGKSASAIEYELMGALTNGVITGEQYVNLLEYGRKNARYDSSLSGGAHR